MRLDKGNVFIIAACVLVALGLGLAFSVLGPPTRARQIAVDQRRIRDLDAIATRIHERYIERRHLPPQLPNYFGVGADGEIVSKDPITGHQYTYVRKDAEHYRLCATFALPSDSKSLGTGSYGLKWPPHTAGQACYAFDVTSFPPEPTSVKVQDK